jgi:hypothetical protein
MGSHDPTLVEDVHERVIASLLPQASVGALREEPAQERPL